MAFSCRVCLAPMSAEHAPHFSVELSPRISLTSAKEMEAVQLLPVSYMEFVLFQQHFSAMRTMCRSCRYAKCVRIGMRTDSVQRNRDIYGKRGDDSLAPCTSLSRPLGPTLPLLEKVALSYSQLESARIHVHSPSGIHLFSNSSLHLPRAVNYKQSIEILLKEFQLVAEWICNSFPCFQTLPDNQKDVLLRNFYLQFVILEGGFFSCRHRRNDIWFLPSGDYIDCVNPETYYYDPEGLQPISSEDAVKMFGSSFATYKRNVTQPMLTDSVDCFEFLTLATLALFATGVEGQSDSCYELCRQVRESVQKEVLHYYQVTKSQEEPPIRLGNILSILPNLQRATRRFREDVELSNVMNAYSVDQAFYDKCFASF